MITTSFLQSRFLQEDRNIGKQTLLTTSLFLWTDRFWKGFGRESCVSPASHQHDCPACSTGCCSLPGCAGQHAPAGWIYCLPGTTILSCAQPQDYSYQTLVTAVARTLLSQMESFAQRTAFSWGPDWQQWGTEPRHREGLRQVYQQSGRHLDLCLGSFATSSNFCCSPVCSWTFASVFADHYQHIETLLSICNLWSLQISQIKCI